MLITDARQTVTEELYGVYDKRELQSVIMILLEAITGKAAKRILANPDAELTDEEFQRLSRAVIRLKQHEPVQYVIGKADFLGLSLAVRPGVLIPRGETEELVDWIIDEVAESTIRSGRKRILDIGCGSGAIGIALAINIPDADVICLDISDEALSQTLENWVSIVGGKENKSRSGSCLTVHNFNILQFNESTIYPDFLKGPFDVVVSNPPYVMASQKLAMDKRVVDFEPASALFVPDDDPLLFYEAIGEFASGHIRSGGALFVEVNDRLGPDTRYLLRDFFSSVELRRDINGKDRMIRASNG